jgi:hypothetical protein
VAVSRKSANASFSNANEPLQNSNERFEIVIAALLNEIACEISADARNNITDAPYKNAKVSIMNINSYLRNADAARPVADAIGLEARGAAFASTWVRCAAKNNSTDARQVCFNFCACLICGELI